MKFAKTIKEQRKKGGAADGKLVEKYAIIVSLRFSTCYFIRTLSLLQYGSFHLHFPSMHKRFFALFRGRDQGELKNIFLPT